MTERNFTEVVPGFYRTRDGELAEVVQILDVRIDQPVLGLIFTNTANPPEDEAWSLGGDYYYGDCSSRSDLITFLGAKKPREKKMVKKTLTRWVNLYEYDITYHDSRSFADYAAAPGRIACVELTGEYEVEVTE